MSRVVLLLVHGVMSSGSTWDPIVKLVQADADIAPHVRVDRFEYSSKAFTIRPTRQMPTIQTIADSLGTHVRETLGRDEQVVVFAHSMGGLVVQRFLVDELSNQRGLYLQQFRSINYLATPNSGSEFLLILRRWARHPQELGLRPLSVDIIETQRKLLQGIVYATESSPTRSPIETFAYAGESDNVVQPASAQFVFPHGGALPGDHTSIHKPQSSDSIIFKILKARVLDALQPRSATVVRSDATPEGTASSRTGSTPAAPFRAPDTASLKSILDALLQIDELVDSVSRRQIIQFLPPYIRQSIGTGANPRLEILSLLQALMRFGLDGRENFVATLEIAFPQEDVRAQNAIQVINTRWPT